MKIVAYAFTTFLLTAFIVADGADRGPCQKAVANPLIFLHDPTRNDVEMDDMFGIRFFEVEPQVDPDEYPDEQTWKSKFPGVPPTRAGWQTSYKYALELFAYLPLQPSDVFYDLGAGFGRIVLTGAAHYPNAKFKAVELVSVRAKEIERVAAAWDMKNLEVINKNVLDVDFSDGTVFYLFYPFPKLMDEVISRLKKIGMKKRIRIATMGFQASWKEQKDWLRPIYNENGYNLIIYESVPRSE